MWRYLLFRFLSRVVPRVSEGVGYRMSSLVADVLFLFARRTRAMVGGNLAHALGPSASRVRVRRLSRRIFRNLLWNYYEMFHLPACDLDDLRRRIHIEGLEHARATMQQGVTAIIVFPHIGNLEILMQIPLLYPEYRFVTLVERMEDDRVFRLMRDLRGSQGMLIASATETLRVMRLLRRGWNLVVAGDFDSTGSGILVDFFDAPARMPDGAVRLALRTGAPLLIGYGWREMPQSGTPGRRQRRAPARPYYRARILPPIELTHTGDRQADARRGVEEVIKRLQPIIAAHLDQWLAFHPFWPEVAP